MTTSINLPNNSNNSSSNNSNNNLNSSILMTKLESVNWCYTMQTILNGVHTTLLAKYQIETNGYAIMLSDFATTYFECLYGPQIDQHYHKYNKAKLTHENILACVQTLLQDLPNTVNNIEKLQVDCHTTRITLRCSKKISNFNFNWNFYIISTDQDVFLKHFSLPLFRGLMYYYNMCQNQQSGTIINNEIIRQEFQPDFHQTMGDDNSVPNRNTLECVNDGLLNDIFRYEFQ